MKTESKVSGALQWYRNHRTEHNEHRRERYADDPKVRLKAKQQAQRYRERLRDGYQPEPAKQYREIDGKKQRVFSTGDVARALGVSTTTIRKWADYAVVPEAARHGNRRIYTERQKNLLLVFSKIDRFDQKARSVASDYIFEMWV